MQKVDYNKQMEQTISEFSGVKPKLLLHSCCAPCSSSVIERLKDFFDITVYYYNPNLDGIEEFTLRANEQKRLCDIFGVSYIEEEYDAKEFLAKIEGLENELEGGSRCVKCFNLRLNKTAKKAKEKGFDYFATTLTVSPLKNANLLNAIGVSLEKEIGIKYLVSDFKKKNGYKRSIELSNEHNLYRQNYCGCAFSKNRER